MESVARLRLNTDKLFCTGRDLGRCPETTRPRPRLSSFTRTSYALTNAVTVDGPLAEVAFQARGPQATTKLPTTTTHTLSPEPPESPPQRPMAHPPPVGGAWLHTVQRSPEQGQVP